MVGDKPHGKWQSILMRGDNITAVSLVRRFERSRERRAGLTMTLLSRMGSRNGFCGVMQGNIYFGRETTLADKIFGWETENVAEIETRLTRDEKLWARAEIN